MAGPDPKADEALRRFVHARNPEVRCDEQRELDEWLADDGNRQEFQKLGNLWAALDGLAAERGRLMPRRRSPAVFAALVILFAGGLLGYFAVQQAAPPGHVREYSAGTAERRQVSLGDGTMVVLNAESSMTVAPGSPPRITLLRGEAYVSVGSGKGLEVRVGRAAVRDIGTRFMVSARGDGGTVDVAEGLVEVRDGAAYLAVAAGRRATFDGAGHVREQRTRPDEVAAWKENRWHFADATLTQIAAEMRRQAGIRLELGDAALAGLTVSGSFGFDEAERALAAVADVHGLKLTQLEKRRYLLSR